MFARELGASLKSMEDGLDCDDLDRFCYHLLVKDARTGAVIASTRLLLSDSAQDAGGSGEPCYDADFSCADILVLVDLANVNTKYVRHFLGRDSVHE